MKLLIVVFIYSLLHVFKRTNHLRKKGLRYRFTTVTIAIGKYMTVYNS